ncbi:hypothetical protein VTN96DRAFT_2336 [Rasamsonia emersonii]
MFLHFWWILRAGGRKTPFSAILSRWDKKEIIRTRLLTLLLRSIPDKERKKNDADKERARSIDRDGQMIDLLQQSLDSAGGLI